MAREGGSYIKDKDGNKVLVERTNAVITTAKPKQTTREVVKNESA